MRVVVRRFSCLIGAAEPSAGERFLDVGCAAAYSPWRWSTRQHRVDVWQADNEWVMGHGPHRRRPRARARADGADHYGRGRAFSLVDSEVTTALL